MSFGSFFQNVLTDTVAGLAVSGLLWLLAQLWPQIKRAWDGGKNALEPARARSPLQRWGIGAFSVIVAVLLSAVYFLASYQVFLFFGFAQLFPFPVVSIYGDAYSGCDLASVMVFIVSAALMRRRLYRPGRFMTEMAWFGAHAFVALLGCAAGGAIRWIGIPAAAVAMLRSLFFAPPQIIWREADALAGGARQ